MNRLNDQRPLKMSMASFEKAKPSMAIPRTAKIPELLESLTGGKKALTRALTILDTLNLEGQLEYR